MELSDEELELCTQKRDEEEGCHSRNGSCVLKTDLGNLSVLLFDPLCNPMKQRASSPFGRWKNKGSQRLSVNCLNLHNSNDKAGT